MRGEVEPLWCGWGCGFGLIMVFWGVIEMSGGGGQRVCRGGRGILRLCDVGCRSLSR